jgi:hypothetical protein
LPLVCVVACCFVRLFRCCCRTVALSPSHPPFTPRAHRSPRCATHHKHRPSTALARPMALSVLFTLLALCSSQTTSPTTSSSPTPTPSCSASPGYFCSGGSALICPVGAYCAGGSALNVSCYPVTACTVIGLSAQPPCYWNVSTLAGNSSARFAEGFHSCFNQPYGVGVASDGSIVIGDAINNLVRSLSTSGFSSTVAGTGLPAHTNGIGTAAAFSYVSGVAIDGSGNVYLGDRNNNAIRKITAGGMVSTLGGSSAGFAEGVGASARFSWPIGVAATANGTVFVADFYNHRIRAISPVGQVSTLAGNGSGMLVNGVGTSACFSRPYGVAVDTFSTVYVADSSNHCIRMVASGGATATLAGTGTAGFLNGAGSAATFSSPVGIAVDRGLTVYVVERAYTVRSISGGWVKTIAGMSGSSGRVDGFGASSRFAFFASSITVDALGNLVASDATTIRQLSCVPCPASYYCISGAPALCPAGSYCPLNSVNPILCPKGTFSSAGTPNCALCPAGTFSAATGSTSCPQCIGGHFCPAGTSSWARFNCGRGSYCPGGSGAPTPCPYQVPPPGGWAHLQVQGPAFLVETAHCLNHCFWNFTSGDGVLSKC